MKLKISSVKSSYSKLTITADEVRLKLMNQISEASKIRTIDLTKTIMNTIDKNLLTMTLRGNFIFDKFDNDNLYIALKYNTKPRKCEAYFSEK